MLIDNQLSHNFWAEVMEITNYLQNCFSTKTKSYEKFISEKKLNNNHQNISDIRIFESKILINISKKKRNKLYLEKNLY